MSFKCMVGIDLCLYHNDILFKLIERESYNIELKANILRLPSVSVQVLLNLMIKYLETKSYVKHGKKQRKIMTQSMMNMKTKNIWNSSKNSCLIC